MFDHIIMLTAEIFTVLTIISIVSERMTIKKASVRGFFRRLRVTLREVTPVWFAVISGAVLIFAAKHESLHMGLAVRAVILFAMCLFCSSAHFGVPHRRKASRRRLAARIGTVGRVGQVGEVPEVGETAVLEELTEKESAEEADEVTN